jgi:hypothetical protein
VPIGVIALRVVLSRTQVEAAGACGDYLAALCASLQVLVVRLVLRPVTIPAPRAGEDGVQFEPVDTLRNRCAAKLAGFGASCPGGAPTLSHGPNSGRGMRRYAVPGAQRARMEPRALPISTPRGVATYRR